MAKREIEFPFSVKETLIFFVFVVVLVCCFTQSYFEIEKKEQERIQQGFEEFVKTLNNRGKN